jgi:hypothetical protein
MRHFAVGNCQKMFLGLSILILCHLYFLSRKPTPDAVLNKRLATQTIIGAAVL